MSPRLIAAVSGAACAALLAALASGCGSAGNAATTAGGDASRGGSLMKAFGCGACHSISGVAGADGKVGPSLEGFADRRYIAGRLPNTPENLVRWIMNPQEVEPGTIMPDLDVTDGLARDMAAYLYEH
jgi:cytochrome c